MYIGLWSRVAGFARDDLTRALEAPRGDPGDADAGHHPPRLARRLLAARARRPRRPPPAPRRRRRTTRGPCAPRWPAARCAARSSRRWPGAASTCGPTSSACPPSGTWERRRADLYAAAEDWIGPPPEVADPVRHLVERYLGGFGPASRKDIASFTGLTPTELAPALEGLVRLRRRAARPPGRAAARSGDPRARAPAPDLGRDAARARPPHRDAARGAPPADLPHEDPAVRAHLPRRRRGGRRVAPHGTGHRDRAVRAPRQAPRCARCARRPSAWLPCSAETAYRAGHAGHRRPRPQPARAAAAEGGRDDGRAARLVGRRPLRLARRRAGAVRHRRRPRRPLRPRQARAARRGRRRWRRSSASSRAARSCPARRCWPAAPGGARCRPST